jgi:membrane protein implicated in regulation of membrane protease activity
MGDLFVVSDKLDAFLLGAFFFGLIFSTISLVLGAIEVPGVHFGHGHSGVHGHANGSHGSHDSDVNMFNLSTILVFVTWFGGVAYLLRNGFSLPTLAGVAGGIAGGVIGAMIVYRFLRLIKGQETYLDASQERLSGSIARVTTPIRDGGTGEIVYELNGVRQVSAARTAAGTMLPRGTEVIVLKRERGIAFVESARVLDPDIDWERRFELPNGSDGSHAPPAKKEIAGHRPGD